MRGGLHLGKWSSGGGGGGLGDLKVVKRPEDFGPCDEFDVITLTGQAYYIVQDVDLGSCRLVSNSPVTIFGSGAEAVTLSASGISDNAIITASDTIQLRTMSMSSLEGAVCVRCAGSGGTAALDWLLVNFLGPGRAVELTDINNFIGDTIGVLGGDGFHVFGTANTIAFDLSIFVVNNGNDGIKLEPGATVNRRLRLVDTAVVVLPGGVGLSVQSANITASEAYILSGVNFSGPGTFIEGIDYLDDKSRFEGCRGVINSTRVGFLSWESNTLVTTIATAGTFVKVNTVSVDSALSQRFDHANNRLTYTSALRSTFLISGVVSLVASNIQENTLAVVLYKNGVLIPGTRQTAITRVTGRAQNVSLQGIVELEQDDYIEIWCTNLDNNSNLVASEGNLLARVITN